MPKANRRRAGGLEMRHDQYRRILQDLTIMNDVFMRNVFKKRECIEYVLQVIMKQKNLQVIDLTIQKDYKNLQGRSAILDCVVRDSENRLMNVEVQQEEGGASPRRARYYSGLLDMNTLEAGQDFDELPQSYVIFITEEDVLGYDLPIYHVERKINEIGQSFRDEAYIIYVNAQKQDNTELGRSMHDLHCRNAKDMYSRVLADRVKELKETPEGAGSMDAELRSLILDVFSVELNEAREKSMAKGRVEGIVEGIVEGRAEGRAEGRKEGRKEGLAQGELKKAREVAFSLAGMGLPADKIAEATKVNLSVVQEWLGESAGK